jgi:hypothetical protein
MVAWLCPTTITELRGFLGLTRYYHKFVCVSGILAKPLTNLLNKQSEWSDEAEHAFLALKHAMSSTHVLHFLDFNKQFIIKIDACNTGVGIVLM